MSHRSFSQVTRISPRMASIIVFYTELAIEGVGNFTPESRHETRAMSSRPGQQAKGASQTLMFKNESEKRFQNKCSLAESCLSPFELGCFCLFDGEVNVCRCCSNYSVNQLAGCGAVALYFGRIGALNGRIR